jgi:serine protease Do
VTREGSGYTNFVESSTVHAMTSMFRILSLWAVAVTTVVHVAHADDPATSRRNAITRAVEKCSPAVVGINVTEIREQVYTDPYGFFDDPIFRRFFQQPREYRQQYSVKGVGSGFLISSDGYIITNDHVAGNASKVVVTMTDGTKHDARIIGADPVSDVALLKIDAKNLPYLDLANSDDVIVGEWAIAFGNPFGLFDNNAKPTVTVGVVSNSGVNFTQPDQRGEERVYKGMIQTDAAISSGNSGGPLVNAEGKVIGVNTVIYSTAQDRRGAGSIGIGFSIPINRVRSIVDRLRKDGKIDRDFWTGMRLQAIDDDVMAYYRLSTSEGILVTRVAGDSPADKAGLEPGDIISEIDGRRVSRTEDVNVAVLDGEVGQTLTLKVLRNGQTKDVALTLMKKPGNRGRR